MNKFFKLIILSCLCLFYIEAFSQPVEFSFPKYYNTVNYLSPLLSAPLAKRYDLQYEGTYYLETEKYYDGTLYYNGILYSDLLLNLDCFEDKLLLKVKSENLFLELNSNLVEYFFLGQRQFIKISPENNYHLSAGFYELVYSQKDTLLRKNIKEFRESVEQNRNALISRFSDIIHYYLIVDGKCVPIKKRQDLLMLYHDRKRDIARHLRGKDIRFRNNPELYILTVLNYLNDEG